jgi:hypothetical protein
MTDDSIRRILWASAFFNLGGAALFAFPESIGRLAGLPAPAPTVYSMLLVLFVLLFGGSYAWIASQPTINRPMVALGAIGKAGAFVTVLLCWLGGAASGLSVLAIAGDLVFAFLFTRWLFATAR